MMQRLIIIVMVAFLSCESPVKEVNRMSEEQLALVMFDMHIADVMLAGMTFQQQDSIRKLYWTKMEERYKLPEEELKHEIQKLESQPEKFKVVLGRVKQMIDSIQ